MTFFSKVANGADLPDSAVHQTDQSGFGRLQKPAFLLLLSAMVTLPLLAPPILPLTDLGGHLGRFAVQLDRGADPHLAKWYSFSWQLLPNLGSDLLMELLTPILGLEGSLRAIVMLAVFLQALGVLSTSRLAHGRTTPFAIFALPLIYGHSFVYGFLNFVLSIGLMWCSVALWIALSRREDATWRHWAVFAVVATALWVCHLVGWALFCIAAGSLELTRQLERRRSLFDAVLACIAPLSCLLVPWAAKILTFQTGAGSGKTEGFFQWKYKFAELFQVFRDQWYLFDVISLEIILALVLWSLLTNWTRLHRGLTLAAVITAACVIVVPNRLLGSLFADQRLYEPMLTFALLSIGFSVKAPHRLPQILFAGAVLFAGARFANNVVSLFQLGNRSAEYLRVLEALPRGAQMVNFRATLCPPPIQWTIDRWTHLGGYALARRHAFSNDQFEIPGGQLLRVHNADSGRFEADDSQIVYEKSCREKEGVAIKASQVPAAIPYLWVIWSGEPQPLRQWQSFSRNGRSVLYRRVRLPSARQIAKN